MSFETPDPDGAAAALAEIEARRRAVEAEERRGRSWQLGAYSVLTLADYAAKDLLSTSRGRWAVTAACQVAQLGTAFVMFEGSRVNPVDVDDLGSAPQTGAFLFGYLAAWVGVERVLVTLLRRSRSRRPNLVAGAALALARPVALLGSQRILPRAGRDRRAG